VADTAKFFRNLGQRVKELRKQRGYSQEDMISFDFSARHWQQIEAGRPITVTTLIKICEAFGLPIGPFVSGLDQGIYERREQSGVNNPSHGLSRGAKRLR
jgi:transcriptional regulator with XRE-family HTH domain